MSKIDWKKILGVSTVVVGAAFVLTSIVGKIKKDDSIFENDVEEKNPLEGKKVIFVQNNCEKENADGIRGHLEAIGESDYKESFYEKYVKRGMDIILSFGGLMILSPLLLIIAIAIKIDDPGPVFFTQKRMGQNKKYFKLHKFRSMKMSTPHDIPTHQLENPEQYITKVGKFLRSHSLDELPQIWDIFIGNMSVIGPRPGLWNQDLLTAERDKYNANDVKPGLTGWAQINGRDELEIAEKARLDGEYVAKIGPLMDLKVFLGSLHVFGRDDSLVEGGTGRLNKAAEEKSEAMNKKILIVANVGKEHINKFHIPTIKALQENGWKVDVACSGDEEIPYCDEQIHGVWKRSPFSLQTIKGIFQLKKILEYKQYDIIYCHTPVGGLVARVSAKLVKNSHTKVIYCAHGLHFYKGAPIINWLVFYPIEKILSYLTDAFFTVNKEDYELVKKAFNKKMKVLYVPEVGVDFSRLNIENSDLIRKKYRDELGISEDTIVFIYVAELIANKNQGMIIDALNLVAKTNQNVHLLLVGPDHNEGKYQEYAKALGVNEKVSFLGWRSDIGELMYAADICVASSIREGFGINIVEAMYCGLPVIATNNRGHVTIITDKENGLLVDVNDFKTMADYMNLLIENKEVREKYSNIEVSQYDCNLIAKELVSLLEKQL